MRRSRTSKGRFTKTRSTKRRKNRSHKRRRNPHSYSPGGRFVPAGSVTAPAKKRRKTRKKAHRKAKRAGRKIRPTVIVSKTGRYYRPARSKYFKRPRRINRRRRNGLGGSLVSIIKKIFTVSSVSNYLGIGGGIFLGTMLSKLLNTGVVPFTTTSIPSSITDTLSNKYVRPFHGFLHIIAGTLIASKMRNKYAKDVGVGLAALGGFDLLTQALSAVGMVGLPTFSGMNCNLLGKTQYGAEYSGMNVDLSGMNVNMLGDARNSDAEDDQLADNINDMIS